MCVHAVSGRTLQFHNSTYQYVFYARSDIVFRCATCDFTSFIGDLSTFTEFSYVSYFFFFLYVYNDPSVSPDIFKQFITAWLDCPLYFLVVFNASETIHTGLLWFSIFRLFVKLFLSWTVSRGAFYVCNQ